PSLPPPHADTTASAATISSFLCIPPDIHLPLARVRISEMNLITELVIANRILANEDVVDAYGHVSVRNPDAPERFFLAHSKSPALVEAGDIVEHTLDGEALKSEPRPLYLERFIHAAIYEAR